MRFLVLITLLFSGACFADEMKNTPEVKTVVVTCASGQLGSEIARLLAPNHNLILTGRNMVKLSLLQESLTNQYSHKYEVVKLDYTDSASIATFKDVIEDREGMIDGLVLVPARPNFGKSEIPEEAVWFEVFKSSFTGPLEALKGTLSKLSNDGKIVILDGVTSVQYMPEYGPTATIRRMWTAYSKTLSHQLGPKGISVNVLSPGVVLTDLHENRIARKAEENSISYDEQMEREVANIPLRRHAQPIDVARSVKFLISEDSNFITGVNLIVDGGFTVSY